jgi:hypothetical protein
VTPLERDQLGMLALLKGRTPVVASPFLANVQASPRLELTREVAVRWRMYQIESQFRYTSRLLKRSASFETRVRDYCSAQPVSPFIEVFAFEFVSSLDGAEEPLVRAVAKTERAMVSVRSGSKESFCIRWDRNPDAVFGALETCGPIPQVDPEFAYLLRVELALPGWLDCVRTPAVPPPSGAA